MFELIYSASVSALYVTCVCIPAGPADELPPKRNDLSPPLLWPSHAKGINPLGSLQASHNQSLQGAPCVSVFMALVALWFISIQCSSDKQLVIARQQPFSKQQTIRQADNRNNRTGPLDCLDSHTITTTVWNDCALKMKT